MPASARSGRLLRHAELWVREWWGGQGGLLGTVMDRVCFPLELLYRAAVALRNRLYNAGILPTHRAPLPVLSVGNITVGGTGKTPFAAWLAEELERRSQVPALVTRGFGRDEVELHRRWAPCRHVIVDPHRGRGALRAAELGASVVVLDDGFQHRRLRRDLDVVLVPAALHGEMRLLPRGPLREPLHALRRADIVAVTVKGEEQDPIPAKALISPFLSEPPVVVRFVPRDWTDLRGRPLPPPKGRCLAVAGVGDPESFLSLARSSLGDSVSLLAFPDHYPYTGADAARIRAMAGGRTVVTTEKDAVKLAAHSDQLGLVAVLRLRVVVEEGEDRLWDRVTSVLGGERGWP